MTSRLKLLLLLLLLAAPARASEAPAQLDPSAVVATVGGEPVHGADVNRLLSAALKDKKAETTALPVLQAQTLAGIVDRRLVLAYARRTQSGPSPEEIQKAFSDLKAKLAASARPIKEQSTEQPLTEADLRRQAAWSLTWPKFLARYITPERLAGYFEAHRREFDGTEIDVSHLLLRPKPGADSGAVEELVQQATAIRGKIASGEFSFADAARKFSAGPSAKDGGRLGFIPRRGVMDEAFSRAAFALEVGQVSQPVKTPFGVHLIRCEAIKPGAKQQEEVREHLEEALGRELLDKIARLEQRHTPVAFTGKAPYFKPDSRELILPGSTRKK